MTLAQHFAELRRRLYWAALALVVGSAAGWFVSDVVMDALRVPVMQITQTQGRTAALNYDSITGAFDLKMQMALTIGVVVSSPVWLYQLWAFFVPGLTRRERRYAFGFFFSAVPLFAVGVVSGWLLVPHIVTLLTGFASNQDSAIIGAKTYFDFVMKLVIAVGIAFVLPLFLVLLNFVGVLSAKSILSSWRVALIVIAIFCAIATPAADVLSMFLLAAPMVSLYFGAAGVAVLHDKRLKRAELQPTFSAGTIA
ncbi:twin-arginine translocase subunit TatC [Leifsonia sp. NPDC058230]|uniref:twin-arginine translocase subunit TatC n=1 Tax=Leifsonia sp. NPDC058230 TaxID=3346391 RepID=UPI0036D8B2B9